MCQIKNKPGNGQMPFKMWEGLMLHIWSQKVEF